MIHKGNREAGAIFDDSERYRYRLWRLWDAALPRILWVMFNPSTADEMKLDPTVTRCYRYAQAWGFGAFEVVNLFALRSTDPKGLLAVADPVGPGNDDAIVEAALGATRTMAAWGSMRLAKSRAEHVRRLLMREGVQFMALKLTKDGSPCHPLYQRSDAQPMPW